MGFGCLVGRGVMKSFRGVTLCLGKFVYSQQPVASAWVRRGLVMDHIFFIFLCLQIYVFGFGHGLDLDLMFC